MCGINAIFSKSKSDLRKKVASMNSLLHLRGPDGEGMLIDGNVALGHTRLSIIDLSERASQPMSNEDGTVWVVFNGEIYNFGELRKELEFSGHHFSSDSDTEVLLHLYEEKGTGMMETLRGMFAFVIYDSKKNELFVARDRMGQKPVLYAVVPDGIYISSEIKPIVDNTPELDLEIDLEALGTYFLHNFRHIPEPMTIYKGVRKLPAASYMVIKDGKVSEIVSYWNPTFKKKKHQDPTKKLSKILHESIKLREISDVEISCLLSGGLDSSCITSIVSGDENGGLKTFSFGFDESDPELLRARKVSALFKTKHKEFVFDPDYLSLMDKLVDYYGEPIYLPPLVYSAVLFKKIRESGIKVTLTGHGADELFFGYNGSNRLMQLSYLFRLTDFIPKGIFSFLAGLISGDLRTLFRMCSVPNWKRKGEIYREKAGGLRKIFSEDTYSKIKGFDFGAIVDDSCGRCDSKWYIDSAYWAGLILENAHSVTIAGDLPAMMNSLEVRSPFLDHKLAEYAFSLHPRLKVADLFSASKNKYLLKKSMEGSLPHDIIYSKKMGFGYGVDIPSLIRGPWYKKFEKRLLEGRSVVDGIFRKKYVQRLLGRHLNGEDHSKILLALYCFERWYMNYGKNRKKLKNL